MCEVGAVICNHEAFDGSRGQIPTAVLTPSLCNVFSALHADVTSAVLYMTKVTSAAPYSSSVTFAVPAWTAALGAPLSDILNWAPTMM